MSPSNPAQRTVLAFIDALTRQADLDELGALLAPDVVSEELPNRLFPQGARRDRAAMLAGAVRGRSVVTDQRWSVEQIFGEGEDVALAFAWQGTLAVDAGSIPRGTTLRARCLGVFRVRDGQITSHRSYDCYEPW